MVYFAVKIKIREGRYPDSTTASFAVSDYQGTASPYYKYFVIYSLFFFYILQHLSRYWLTFSLPITEEFLP